MDDVLNTFSVDEKILFYDSLSGGSQISKTNNPLNSGWKGKEIRRDCQILSRSRKPLEPGLRLISQRTEDIFDSDVM